MHTIIHDEITQNLQEQIRQSPGHLAFEGQHSRIHLLFLDEGFIGEETKEN
jgi:hypothetical protein